MRPQTTLTALLILLAIALGSGIYYFLLLLTKSHILCIPFVGLMGLAVGMVIFSNVIIGKQKLTQ